MAIPKPSDVEAEKEILASCFAGGGPSFDSEAVMKLTIGGLTPAHFAHPMFKQVFVSMVEAVSDNTGAVDWGMVRSYIPQDQGARDTLRKLVTEVNLPPVSESSCNRMIKKLDNAYRGRKLAELASSVQTNALAGNSDLAFDTLAAGLTELMNDRNDHGGRYIKEFIPEMLKEFEDRRKAEGGIVGFRTGLAPLDYVFKGLQRKNLYFIAARPGHGKSLSIGQVFYNLSVRYPDMKVLLASAEQDAKQYMSRIAASIVGLDYDKYTGGEYDEKTEQKLKAVIEPMERNPIIINEDGGQSTLSLRQDLIRFQPDVLLVDYAQEFEPSRPKYTEYQDTTMFVRELNAMKKQFNISILSALQLSRAVENRPVEERRPIQADIRGSGWIEQAADGIFGLYREKEYAASKETYDKHIEYFRSDGSSIDPSKLEWVCLKNRHGIKRDVMTYIADGSMFISNEPVRR